MWVCATTREVVGVVVGLVVLTNDVYPVAGGDSCGELVQCFVERIVGSAIPA